MSFFSGLIVGILSLYLSATNLLAERVETLFTLSTENEAVVTERNTGDVALTRVESETTGTIPRILLENAAYQEAALYNSLEYPGATTDDPREAIVNIYCTRLTDTYLRTTTGTGFFIHPNGVILTNAHVAQFLLLEDNEIAGEVECLIRTGDPAVAQYRADLLYLPPSWIQAHAEQIREERPAGTGERDYALLYVTSGLENRPMPATFPALQTDPALLKRSVDESSVRVAGYPAGALMSEGRSVSLSPRLATTTISELFTFGSNYADLFSLRGSSIGEQGSSGGPVIGENGEVIGLITTRGDDAADGAGSLRAITISHVDRTIREETGYSLQANVSGDLPLRAKLYNDTLAPFLSRILTRELNSTTD